MFCSTLTPQRLLTLLLLTCCVVFGQGTDLGSIQGVVTDASGASVPGAAVTITAVSADSHLTLQTNGTGEYEANGLRYSTYRISVAATGLSTLEISGVVLRPGSTDWKGVEK
jgi:cobalamin biosynthesis protein CobD/CbiB